MHKEGTFCCFTAGRKCRIFADQCISWNILIKLQFVYVMSSYSFHRNVSSSLDGSRITDGWYLLSSIRCLELWSPLVRDNDLWKFSLSGSFQSTGFELCQKRKPNHSSKGLSTQSVSMILISPVYAENAYFFDSLLFNQAVQFVTVIIFLNFLPSSVNSVCEVVSAEGPFILFT